MATAIHCDGPGCTSWQRDHEPHRICDAGWLHIQYVHDHSEMWHFCTWDCVMAYAANKTPKTEIQL